MALETTSARRVLALLLLASTVVGVGRVRCASESDAGADFFERHVRPILDRHCLKCHSGPDPKGGLSLAWRGGWAKGGSRGPALLPGAPERSLLIQAVAHRHSDLQMPKNGARLSFAEIESLRKWVRMGAYDPRKSEFAPSPPEVNPESVAGHWSFQPLKRPPIPEVNGEEWCATPMDRFVLDKLEEALVPPSPPVDRRTWLRRVCLDLLGVPPSPGDVDAFVFDGAPDAERRWVERLLADPRYGERWGRHWLDVARYADTAGYRAVGQQRRFPYSHTYRDYVVDTFNRDLSFDQFVREQIAADLIPEGRRNPGSLAALGMLTIGRSFLDDPVLEVDDRIDVVTRGLLGLTVQCARCHDHKYDPIPTADYYSLYGVFASVEQADPGPLLELPSKRLHAGYLEERKRRQRAYEERFAEEVEKAHHRIRAAGGRHLLALHESGGARVDARFLRERKLNPVVFRQLRQTINDLRDRSHSVLGPWLALVPEMGGQPISGNPYLSAAVEKSGGASPAALAVVYDSVFAECDRAEPFADPAREEIRGFLRAKDSPFTVPESGHWDLVQLVREPLNELRAAIAELDAEHPGAPVRAMSVVEKAKPVKPVIFIRGNPRHPGDAVPRRMLALVSGPDRPRFDGDSGRLGVAEAIADPSNPLTARVFVNRLWWHHFGAALVDSPNDFGMRAEPPTHPELLDWLAMEFIDSGWSIKHLHRLVLLSATYRQSSVNREVSSDPGNRLMWRMNRRRLDVESMRDSMLSVTGLLDWRQGGQAGDLFAPGFQRRRSIYAFIDRSDLSPFHRAFDLANPDVPVGRRTATSVPQQALFLMNSRFIRELAEAVVGDSVFAGVDQLEDRVKYLWRRFFQRLPSSEDLADARAFFAGYETASAYHGPVGWQYGVGRWDRSGERVAEFVPFDLLTNGVRRFSWNHAGGALLHDRGGRPPDSPGRVVVRRWIAPTAGTIRLLGQLSCRSTEGDGVNGWAVSDRQGVLGHWRVRAGAAQAVFADVSVTTGERVDFICGGGDSAAGDDFIWIPRVEYAAFADKKDVGRVKFGWGAKADFNQTFAPLPRKMDRWEQYAQVLLQSNELHFID